MSMLSFDDSEPKRPSSKKPIKLFLGISALVGALAVGSTLASNINLNNGNNVEFGQGVVVATSCDKTISIVPTSSFVSNPSISLGSYNPNGLNSIRASVGIGGDRSIQGVAGIVEARVVFTGPSNSERTRTAIIQSSGVGTIISARSDGLGSITPLNGVNYNNGAMITTDVYQSGGTDSFSVTATSAVVGTQTLSLIRIDDTTGVPTFSGNFIITWLAMPPQDSELTHEPYFEVDTITISDIANSCQGKVFTLSGYSEGSEETLFTPVKFRVGSGIRNSNYFANGNWSNQVDVLVLQGGALKEAYINTEETGQSSGELGTTSITIQGFDTPGLWNLAADQLDKITLQSSQ